MAASAFDVTAYPVDSRGDAVPLAVTTDMIEPRSIARDAAGNLYVINAARATVAIYPPGANGNVAPLAVIGGTNAGLGDPIALALDAAGDIYALDSGWSQTDVYPPLEAVRVY